MNTLIKCVILSWGVPLAIILVVIFFTPNPHLPESAFSSEIFTPTRIEVLKKQGRKGSDYFELWLHHPEGHSYYHRDPEPEPIHTLDGRIPREVPLKVIYTPSQEGNVLMGVAPAADLEKPALSFKEVMAQYGFRRRVVYIVAAVWFTLAHLFLLVLWRMEAPPPSHILKASQERRDRSFVR